MKEGLKKITSKQIEQIKDDIRQYKKQIHADAYPMSIGELINMYRDGELEVHPEFQRLYRWSEQQKTNFIESILLGIPIPSFFVSQRNDGIWEIVDGMQRISTILSFVGELKDEEDNYIDKLHLLPAKYIKSLDNVSWDDLDKSIQIDFKREKIDFKIIKKESTADTKYDLFQRLNTGGSALSDQEVRNCILIMTNKNFYEWFITLSKNKYFKETVMLSDNQYSQRYDHELITRIIVFRDGVEKFKSINKKNRTEIGQFMTEEIASVASDFDFDKNTFGKKFNKTFLILSKTLAEDTFRRYEQKSETHKGPFSISLFEAITIGIYLNCDSYNENSKEDKNIIIDKILELNNSTEFLNYSKSGVNSISKMIYHNGKTRKIY